MESHIVSLKNIEYCTSYNSHQNTFGYFDIYENSFKVELHYYNPNSWNGKSFFTFVTAAGRNDWTCFVGGISIRSICDMMKLFFMNEKSIKMNKLLMLRGLYFDNFSMDYSFAENIFYIMIFRLAVKYDMSTIRQLLSDYFEKYKLLRDCTLPELTNEISKYFVYFIFFDR